MKVSFACPERRLFLSHCWLPLGTIHVEIATITLLHYCMHCLMGRHIRDYSVIRLEQHGEQKRISKRLTEVSCWLMVYCRYFFGNVIVTAWNPLLYHKGRVRNGCSCDFLKRRVTTQPHITLCRNKNSKLERDRPITKSKPGASLIHEKRRVSILGIGTEYDRDLATASWVNAE